MPTAWLLNLDADDELRNPIGYQVSRAVLRRTVVLAQRMRALARPGDVILAQLSARSPEARAGGSVEPELVEHERVEDERSEPTRMRQEMLGPEFVGRTWCPTPRALARLAEAGVSRPQTPDLEVLRRVNHRAFGADLGQTLPGARYVRSLAELRAHVAEHPAQRWVLKRPYGFSGRGSKRVELPWGALHSQIVRWIEVSLERDGGLQAEPWVEREKDFALHGYVERTRALRIGTPCLQECDAFGAWVRTVPAGEADLRPAEHNALIEIATSSGRALAESSYFGPFGIDAFRWRDADGEIHFNPRSEINARLTMGWHIGMGRWRPGPAV